jgi:uncharacterized protein
MRRALAIGLVIGLLAVGCSHRDELRGRVVFQTGSGHASTGPIRVADTDAEREHGLMGVSHLAPNDGMVFLFDGPTTASFWMKNTLVPLSVAFWNERGRVVDVLDMRPCTNDPCPLYTPTEPYTTALEMGLGWFHQHGIAIGDHADLSTATD